MIKRSNALKMSGIIFIASSLSAAPAFAQLGGLTGSVGGALDTSANTRIDAPDVRVPAKVRVESRTQSRSSGGHYHGGFYHDHGAYAYDHYHDDDFSHAQGYASLTVELRADQNRADVGPMLTYGQKVESKKGKDLGRITSMSKTESGMVTSINVDGVPKAIPVDTLKVDGDVLVTSLKKKKLK